MAVDKVMTPSPVPVLQEDPEDIEVSDDTTTETDENGNVTVTFGDPDENVDTASIPHDANLAEYLEEDELSSLVSELLSAYNADDMSRKDWGVAYMKGLDLLGTKIEDRQQPWVGASGVYHPLLTEAVVRFQAQAMSELMPAAGPARTKIMGKLTPDRVEQAQRVEAELNYQITERMPEYRNEMEQMLFKLPLAGSAFKKIYFDPVYQRPVSVFVPAEDFVVSFGASNLRTCDRYTHVMRVNDNDVKMLQVSGFYRDVELGDPTREVSEIEEAYQDLQGVKESMDDDPRRTVLEMHVDIDLPEPFNDPDGLKRPYVVTIDKSTQTVLAIRKNWYEDDPLKNKRMHFVHYPYLPGVGFYGTGLTHLIGGLAKSATSILRQLIDAGTLANLPAGLKARGLRIKGDDTPVMPGEWRDVDVPGGAIKDSIYPMPYKEPSATLYQLLGNVVDEGRRIGSIADIKISDMSAQAPVGTTLALLERTMKVQSGVQSRLHAAMKQELRILARIIKDYMPKDYDYMVDDKTEFDRVKDFSAAMDIVPVSDPNAATMAQRIMQYQAALQLAQGAPQLYDMGKLHQQMLEVLGIQDATDIIKMPGDMKPMDPIAENMAILKQEPVKAFLYQDHEAHIQAHMMAAQDPKLQQIVGQSPFASVIQSAMMAHITEHVAYKYRGDIEKQLGVALPPEGEPLPEDVEIELSRLTAQAASKLFQKDKAEVAAQQAQQQLQDPLVQLQLRQMALREAQFKHQQEMDKAKLALDANNKQVAADLKHEQISSQERQTGAQIGAQLASQMAGHDANLKAEKLRSGIGLAQTLIQTTAQDRASQRQADTQIEVAKQRPKPTKPSK